MVFKFIIISDEVDNFLREIEIDADSTFLDLQNAVLDAVGYTKDQMTSFFTCDDDWNKETEITRVEMDSSSDVDIYLMAETRLEELLEEEKQKLIFVFDYLTDRCFFMELHAVVPGANLEKSACIRSKGEPPVQVLPLEEFETKQATTVATSALLIDDNFYGDSEFNMDEIDKEGFEGFGNEAGGDNTLEEGF